MREATERGYKMSNKATDYPFIDINELKPYKNNARLHPQEQIEKITNSIKEFGFITPVIIDENNTVLVGHGRTEAAKAAGLTQVPYRRITNLTDDQKRAYILADNKLSDIAEWDETVLMEELEKINFDMTEFGFDDFSIGGSDFFDRQYRWDDSRQEGNDEYNEFLDKFEIAKTTDDCYTPELVYDAVVGWVENEYGVKRENFVRPFYPGGDYQKEKYKKTDIVVDNPPFSILSEILKYYTDNGVKFFLFAPALTLFSSSSLSSCAIGAGAQIVYENKANVSTSFLTNLEMEHRFRTAPTLYAAIAEAIAKINAENGRELAKNNFPDEVITSTKLSYFSKYGVDFRVKREETELIRCLDAQKETKQSIYGSGYLISEKAAAEKAAATVWVLSEREKEIVKHLGGD